jgi:hypothetical protein
MARVGVRTTLKDVEYIVGLGTDTLIWMDTGAKVGESNKVGAGTFNSVLGRALNFSGNKAGTRKIPECTINRKTI